MCPNRGDRDLEQFGGHGTDTFLRHDYATTSRHATYTLHHTIITYTSAARYIYHTVANSL